MIQVLQWLVFQLLFAIAYDKLKMVPNFQLDFMPRKALYMRQHMLGCLPRQQTVQRCGLPTLPKRHVPPEAHVKSTVE